MWEDKRGKACLLQLDSRKTFLRFCKAVIIIIISIFVVGTLSLSNTGLQITSIGHSLQKNVKMSVFNV